MHLVPIPTTPEYLNASSPLWSPFLPQIAARSPWSVEELRDKLRRLEVQPILVFEGQTPVVLIGVCFWDDSGARVGEVRWMTFRRDHGYRAERAAVLADLERYLHEHVKCAKCRAVPPPGWQRFLERHGYVLIGNADDRHIIMEKVL